MNAALVRTTLALSALCVAYPMQTQANGEAHHHGKLGTVHFKVECNAAAQREFNLAMAYYHSFVMEQMKAPLERTLQLRHGPLVVALCFHNTPGARQQTI